MTRYEKEVKAQEQYKDVVRELEEAGFYQRKGAQGQWGCTRETVEDSYTIWETVSFSEGKIYVYRQLNPWTPFKKHEMEIGVGIIESASRILEVVEVAKKVLYNS